MGARTRGGASRTKGVVAQEMRRPPALFMGEAATRCRDNNSLSHLLFRGCLVLVHASLTKLGAAKILALVSADDIPLCFNIQTSESRSMSYCFPGAWFKQVTELSMLGKVKDWRLFRWLDRYLDMVEEIRMINVLIISNAAACSV